MVMAYDNARRRHSAMTFLLRVVTISEICEELNLVWRSGKTSLIRHRALEAPLSAKCRQATYVRAMSAFQGEMSVSTFAEVEQRPALVRSSLDSVAVVEWLSANIPNIPV